jgi:hypothetical protein
MSDDRDEMDPQVMKEVITKELEEAEMEVPRPPVGIFQPDIGTAPVYGFEGDPGLPSAAPVYGFEGPPGELEPMPVYGAFGELSEGPAWTEEEQALIDEWAALGDKKDEASRQRAKEIDQELHRLRFPKPNTRVENMADLLEALEGMDVPEARLQLRPMDVRWLNRNLHFQNAGHPRFNEARKLIKKILIQIDRGE